MTVLLEIAQERLRQLHGEGFDARHDDMHDGRELASAAASYAYAAWQCPEGRKWLENRPPVLWPWSTSWWKPTTPRRDLIKAAALIVAEVERIDRSEGGAMSAPQQPASKAKELPGLPWAVRPALDVGGGFDVYPTWDGELPRGGEWAPWATINGPRKATARQIARLFAAAPELLEACKLAVAAMGPMDAARHIQKAIDKAEGRA